MSHEKISTTERVCVTGANGFLGSFIVKELLHRGYTVRGTVRSTTDEAKTAHLRALPNAAKLLELVEADLNEEYCFDEAFKDCKWVIHSASPFTFHHKDAKHDLVDPAVKGTLSALSSALKNRVTRVVLTSSIGAITDEPIKRYTEEDWNTASSLKRSAYYYSKTLAERAAWDFMEKHKNDQHCFELVAILPGALVGAPLSVAGLDNPPNNLLYQVLDGKLPGLLDFGLSMVSVSDVALAHVTAMETPEAKGQRYIVTNHHVSVKEMAERYRQIYPNAKISKFDMTGTNWTRLMRFFTWFMKDPTYQMVHLTLGKKFDFDTSKAQKELGIVFRDVWAELDNVAAMMIDVGMVKSVKK